MPVRQLQLAGLFRELPPPYRVDQPQPSIFEAVREEPLPDVDRVAGYLRDGHPLIDIMDVQDDPFDPAQRTLNGPSLLTDGDWLWRYDLGYYVERRGVDVPSGLLTLIRDRDYRVPPRSVDELTACGAQAAALLGWAD